MNTHGTREHVHAVQEGEGGICNMEQIECEACPPKGVLGHAPSPTPLPQVISDEF